MTVYCIYLSRNRVSIGPFSDGDILLLISGSYNHFVDYFYASINYFNIK